MAYVNAGTTTSHNKRGDLTTNGGQLGYSYEAAVAANLDLINVHEKNIMVERYSLEPTGGDRVISLPPVSDAAFQNSTGVKAGFKLFVKNISDTNSLDLNSGVNLIVTLEPGFTALLNSTNDATPNNWRIFGVLSENAVVPQDVTLQDAYDFSDATTSKIQLDETRGAIQVRDTATFLDDVFSVSNDDDSTNHFRVKNTTPTTDTPAIDLLAGTSNNPGSLTMGGATSNADNSVTLSSGKAVTNAENNSMLTSFELYTDINGVKQHGEADSDPFKIKYYGKVTGIDTSTVVPLFPSGLQFNTTYLYKLSIVGRDEVNTAETVSHIGELKGAILLDGTTSTLQVISETISYHPDAVLIADEGVMTMGTDGADILNITLEAPASGIDGETTTMTYVWELTLIGWSSA